IVLVRNWPFQQSKITAAIRSATSRDVEIRDFRRTYFPPGCVVGSVKVLHGHDKNAKPLITIQELTIRSSYTELLKLGDRIDEVRVKGMRLLIPPKRHDGQGRSATPLLGGGG